MRFEINSDWASGPGGSLEYMEYWLRLYQYYRQRQSPEAAAARAKSIADSVQRLVDSERALYQPRIG